MKMTAGQMVKVIEGFQNGKEIQFKNLFGNWVRSDYKLLYDIIDDILNCNLFYRVKPEDKYRPYKTIDEAMELMGKVLRRKNSDHVCIVNDITLGDVTESIYINGLSAEYIFDNYEYYDKGMRHIPLGVKE